MNKGFIQLHRSLLEWEWYDDNNTKILFLHCLLKANYKDKNYRGSSIKRGSFVTGRDVLAKELGLSVQQVRTSLTKLKSTNEITIKSSSQGTVIEVIKYNDYQEVTNKTTNEQPTSNQQVTTTNNINNINNTIEPYKMPDDKYAKACKWFFDELLKRGKIKKSQNWQTKTWYDSFRLLEQSDGIDWTKEFTPVIKYYVESIGKEYCPEAYSPKAVRTKWIKLQGYKDRNENNTSSKSENAFDALLKKG
jgi:hypothetical protein